MRYSVLGPLRVSALTLPTDNAIPLGPPLQRRLLALLLSTPGAVFSTERLIEELWPDGPPPSAARNVATYVWSLRRSLGSQQIVNTPTGYRIMADPRQVDSAVFADDVGRGFAELRRGNSDRALTAFEGALAHWRGVPFEDIPATGALLACRVRLEEQRRTVRDKMADLLLDAGRHDELIDILHGAIDAEPLRERSWAQLMTALVHAGRRAEALATYHRLHRLLADELGVEPASDLQRLHARILHNDLELVRPAEPVIAVPPSAVPRQLPPYPPDYVGRVAELDALDRIGTHDDVAVIAVISGMAGVGKTALAVRWAYRSQARFPDGQIFVDLGGYGPGKALSPVEAAAHVLAALGVPTHQIPTDEQRATGQLRSLLANRKILLIVDNATAAADVRPLLVGGPGTTVLVVSRTRLAGLVARDGARQLDLPELSIADAVQLVDPEATEPEASRELAVLCGGLPLALRIASAQLDHRSVRPIAQLVARLRDGDRLAELAVPGDASSSMERAFAVSHDALTDLERVLFRRLGLLPVRDFGVPVAAALVERNTGETTKTLHALVDTFLVRSLGDGRFALHDLIREYAIRLAEMDNGRDEALRRAYRCYLAGAEAAALALYPQMQRLPVPRPIDAVDVGVAAAWLAAEHRNLVMLITSAASRGVPEFAWLLCSSLRGHFMARRDTIAWQAAAEAAHSAAAAAGDSAGQAVAQLALGLAAQSVGAYRDSIPRCSSAEHLAVQARWQPLAAAAANAQGVAHSVLGETADALVALDRGLATHRRAGSTAGAAIVLNNLAVVHTLCGRLDLAEELYQEALAIHTSLGTRRGAASTLVGLGVIDTHRGLTDAAQARLSMAAETYRALRDVEGEMCARVHLAEVSLAIHDAVAALKEARIAVAALRPTGDLHMYSRALSCLAAVRRHGGRFTLAMLHQRTALRLAYAAASRQAVVTALLGSAALSFGIGALQAASGYAEQASKLARPAGYLPYTAEAVRIGAEVRWKLGDRASAAAEAAQAVDLLGETGCTRDLLRAEQTLRLVTAGIVSRPAG
ncbi:BTAD domain-containing putative transcriptional regulator [Dactylosporangium sp. NPDC000521]|uniref:AfsR/SARP family transcriptional regulator n=1 Tax=Dactylosporangium sp. NPDC000521 TaxID=3363975 RepID=UPI0036B209AC